MSEPPSHDATQARSFTFLPKLFTESVSLSPRRAIESGNLKPRLAFEGLDPPSLCELRRMRIGGAYAQKKHPAGEGRVITRKELGSTSEFWREGFGGSHFRSEKQGKIRRSPPLSFVRGNLLPSFEAIIQRPHVKRERSLLEPPTQGRPLFPRQAASVLLQRELKFLSSECFNLGQVRDGQATCN